MSFKERERMFKLPRSSWDDYDKSLISKGGGVFPRSAKSIPLSPEVKAALGIDNGVTRDEPGRAAERDPQGAGRPAVERRHRHLRQGHAARRNADVGDRANNALRVNGRELRCKVVGEGGNLGMTQLGRIEAAQHGVLLNTDFIDNSAGVDTSDHEVNIKILLNGEVQKKKLDAATRATSCWRR